MEGQDDFDDIVAFIEDSQIEGFHPLSDDASDCDKPPRKRERKERKFDEAFRRLEGFNFCEDEMYSKEDFERRSRMPRRMFDRIENAIKGKGAFREGKRDALGKEGTEPKRKPILRYACCCLRNVLRHSR